MSGMTSTTWGLVGSAPPSSGRSASALSSWSSSRPPHCTPRGSRMKPAGHMACGATTVRHLIQPVTAAPLHEDDIWLFLRDFKRIEAPGLQPFPLEEAVRRTLRTLGLTPAGEKPALPAPQPMESAEELVALVALVALVRLAHLADGANGHL